MAACERDRSGLPATSAFSLFMKEITSSYVSGVTQLGGEILPAGLTVQPLTRHSDNAYGVWCGSHCPVATVCRIQLQHKQGRLLRLICSCPASTKWKKVYVDYMWRTVSQCVLD